MDDVKKTYREGEQETKEAWREADGDDSVADHVGNVGDELRKQVGNVGDDLDATRGQRRRLRQGSLAQGRRRREPGRQDRQRRRRHAPHRGRPPLVVPPFQREEAPARRGLLRVPGYPRARCHTPTIPTRRRPHRAATAPRPTSTPASMSSSATADMGPVADALVAQRTRILDRWVSVASRQPFHAERPDHSVSDHIPELFDAVVDVLRRRRDLQDDESTAPLDDDAVSAAAIAHAQVRFDQGLGPVAVVTEFRILRQEIGRAMASAARRPRWRRAMPWRASPSSAMRSTVPPRSA